ncbi:MAG: hypothetical protein KGJ93_04385, partial [Patescibacteria group bacterium]|nr:hypothetical protein [Patescibacteria group bacterium]
MGGSFGIGTTGPGSLLSIQGTSTAPTTTLLTVASSSGAQYLTVAANGNVGIGTTNLSYPLQVSGTVYATNYLANSGQIGFGNYNGYNGLYLGTHDLGFSYFDGALTHTGFVMSASTGNVGIGTTSPSARLSVTGTAAVDPFDISSTSGISLMHVNQAGALSFNGQYGTTGQILQSNGNASSPTWISTSTLASSLNAYVQGGNSFGATGTLGTLTNNALQLMASSSPAITILPNGNVGIGTANPLYPLHVKGGLGIYAEGGYVVADVFKAVSGNVAAPAYLNYNSSGNGMYFPGANLLGLVTNSTERLRIDSSGNVGLSTTTPTALLSLAASTTAAGGINFGDSTANLYRSAAGSIKTDGAMLANEFQGTAIRTQTSATLGIQNRNFTAGNTDAVQFTPLFTTSGSGNAVVILPSINQTVTTGISRGLYVNPTLTSAYDFRGLETAAYIATTSQTSLLNNILFNQPTYATTGAATLANAINLSVSGAPIAGPNITISSSSALTISGGSIQGGGAVTNAYGLYVNAPTGATNNIAAAFMGGNVGIGTSTPAATLSLRMANNNTSQFLISSTTDSYSTFGVDNKGRVRLGADPTLVPMGSVVSSSIYEVVSNDGAKSDFVYYVGSSNGYPSIYLSRSKGTPTAKSSVASGDVLGSVTGYSYTNGWGTSAEIDYVSDGAMSGSSRPGRIDFLTQNGTTLTNRMTIKSTGNVGIGTTTPGAVLALSSSGTIDPFDVYSTTTGSSVLHVTYGGNVGIGTTTPSQALVVNGQVQITGGSPALGKVLQSDANGVATWVATSTLGITGGSGVTGGQNGYAARFTSATTLATSTLIDNGSVLGINATSSSYTFNLQGTSGVNPFNISSSTGTSLLTVTQNGYVGIGTTSPSQLLTVGNNNQFTVDSSGNVHSAGSIYVDNIYSNVNPLIINNINQLKFNNSDYIAQDNPSSFDLSFFTGSLSPLSRMTIQSGGNVGIGTTTPGQLLTVAGAIQITGGSPAQGKVLQSDANGIATWVATSTLGISGGSASPGGSSGQVQYNNNGTFAGSAALLTDGSVAGVNATSSSYTFNIQGSAGVNPFNISSSTGTSLLTVLANGKVGIGTATPIALLNVQTSNASTTGSGTVSRNTPGALTGSGTAFLSQLSNGDELYATGTIFGIVNSITSNTVGNTVPFGSALGGANYTIAQPALKAVSSDGKSGVVVSNSGYTNIGNTNFGFSGSALTVNDVYAPAIASPPVSGTLTVLNNGSSNGNYLFVAKSGAGTFIMSNGGNMAIATTSLAQTLNVSGTMRLTGALFDSNNASGTLGMVLQSTGTGQQWVATSTLGISGGSASPGGSSGQVQYNNNGIFAGSAALLTDGNVAGVNATSSSYTFNIQGSSGANPFRITSSTGSTLFVVTQGGNVGIGNPTPNSAYALDVSGSINLTGSISVGSAVRTGAVYGGINAGNSLILQASSNNPQSGYVLLSPAGGSIGVGSSTPSAQFAIGSSSTTQPTVLIMATSSQTSAILTIASSSGSSYLNVSASGLTTVNQLTVSGTATLASATTTINGVTYYWPTALPASNKILQSDASGNLTWVTDQTGGGGSVSGGSTGFVATWASSTGLTYGTLRDNGTVSGVNATSSSYTFNIQGSSGVNPFNISSSTGTSLLMMNQNGYLGLGTTTPAYPITISSSNNPVISLANSTTGITWQMRNGVDTAFSSHLDFYDQFNNMSLMELISGANAGSDYVRIGTSSNAFAGGGAARFVVAGGNNGGNIAAIGTPASDQAQLLLAGSDYLTNVNGTTMTYYGASGTGASYGFSNQDLGVYSVTGTALFGTENASPLVLATNFAERMRITGTGLVGIGTASPSALLDLGLDASSTASSTLYTVASATPVLQLGQYPLSSPSTNGTYLAINAPSSFSGDYMNMQVNGVIKTKITSSGILSLAGGLLESANNTTLMVRGSVTTGNGYAGIQLSNNSASRNPTSGNNQMALVADTIAAFNPVSGSAVMNALEVQGMAINQTGSANGITRAQYLNPTLTSVYDYRNLENAPADVTISNAGNPVSQVYNVLFNPLTYGTASTSVYTIATSSTFAISGAPTASTTRNTLLTNSIAALIQGGSLNASTTNGYGLYVNAPTGATNNYAATFMGGNVGIGTTTPGSTLDVWGNLNVATSSSPALFVNTANGSVGIGTASPGTGSSAYGGKLQVYLTNANNGIVSDYAYNGGALSNTIGLANGSDGAALFASGADMLFKVNSSAGYMGSELMRLTSTGRLGIGTSTPSARLSVTGASAVDPFDISSTSGVSLMHVTQAGNVGIGTSTPNQALVVNGQVQITGGSPAQGSVLQSDANGIATWVATSTLGITGGSGVTGGQNGYAARFTSATTLATSTLIDNGSVLGINATSSSYTFNIQGSSGVNPFNVSSSTGTSLLTVTQNGYVGIGTATPGSTLVIQGVDNTSSNSALNVVNSSGTSILFARNDGSLGFGILTPDANSFTFASNKFLEFQGTSQNQIVLNHGGSYWGMIGASASAPNSFTLGYTTSRSATFGTGLLWWTTYGTVGINSSTPQASLVVQASSSAQTLPLLTVASTTGSSYVTVLPNGQVGIGSSSPVAQFVVEDSGQTGANSNILLGHNNKTGFDVAVAQSSFAAGVSNVISGAGNFVAGQNNTVGGWYGNAVFGEYNSVTSDGGNNIMGGYGNI